MCPDPLLLSKEGYISCNCVGLSSHLGINSGDHHELINPVNGITGPQGDALYAMELALSLEKLNFQKLRQLHAVASEHSDASMSDFVEGDLLGEQVWQRGDKHVVFPCGMRSAEAYWRRDAVEGTEQDAPAKTCCDENICISACMVCLTCT